MNIRHLLFSFQGRINRAKWPTLALVLLFSGCGESEAVRREREATHAQRLAQIEVEKARAMEKLKLEAAEAAETGRRQRLEEEQRRIRAEQIAEASRLQSAKLKLVKELTFTTRTSLLDETDQVLQIRNPNPQSIDVYVKCSTPGGYSKTIFVSVAALQTAEVGILEGWNFRRGEKFEIIYDNTVVHSYTIR